MRVVLITLGIYPIQTGGVEVLSFQHLRKLIERGHITVCYTKRTSNDRVVPSGEVYPVHLLGSATPIIGSLLFLTSITWELLKLRKKIDVIHVQYAGYFVMPAYFMRVFAGIPYVVSCVGSDLLVWGRRRIWGRFQKVLLSRASFVTALSTELGEFLAEKCHLPASRILVTPNVIDDTEIEEVKKDHFGSRTKRRIIFVGNLKPVKDPMTTVKAFHILHEKLHDVELVVVGDGPCRTRIVDFVRTETLQDSVSLTGSIAHADALRQLRESDVLVVSSLSEGGPTVAMEAMALGVPVVGTRVGGLKDLIADGRTGLLVPVQAPEELADAIYKVVVDKTFALRLVEEARQRIAGRTWSNLITTYEDLYRRAIGGKAHHE